MVALPPCLGSTPKLFVFGPQALSFDGEDLKKLSAQLRATLGFAWVHDAVASLKRDWDTLCSRIPNLEDVKGKQLLEVLDEGLQTGDISPSLLPLPNILLTPLVVIAQLTQYAATLRSALPDLADTDKLEPSILSDSTETMGLCTGILSALAVACSSTLEELRHYGDVVVRLAALIGAVVDAEEANSAEGKATSLSASWTNAETTGLDDVLKRYPEAYISVLVDQKRATITTSKDSAPQFIQQLKLGGVHVTELALHGRFHWPAHQKDMQQLLQFCDSTPGYQLPDASKLILPCRSNPSGEYLTAGKLHHAALRATLLEASQWYNTFSTVYRSTLAASDALVVCFGPERCIPPSIARKLDSKLFHVSDISLALTSPLLAKLAGRASRLSLEDLPDERIAVIGMSCQVPGAGDLEEYWNILRAGQSQHREVPADRFTMETAWRELDPKRKWYGNFINDHNVFDHKFFKKSPREMASTDPQHRLILQLAYQAVEQSGYFGAPDFNKHIGCYMGVGNVDYEDNIACYPANAYSATGNLKSFLAGKVSHYFGWTGPSLTLDTACSSSSVAIHHACRAIINGECTAALAGGVNVITSPDWYHNLAGASFLSPTGQCKPFDSRADGYCRGEGAGVVFLKKLSSAVADGDQVVGVIASTRVYQNQNCTAITVPNAESLSELFVDVLRQARLEAPSVSVVEAHGTGTPVGDPAEYDGIRRVFGGPTRSDTLALTSVKGLLGHTECASGVVSLIKTLLMINEATIPPQPSFASINPSLNATADDRIEIPTRLKPWDAAFRVALINNYGASGSNASMVVTQAPSDYSRGLPTPQSRKAFPFWLSGLDESSLRAYVSKLRKLLLQEDGSSKDLGPANLSFQVSRQSNRSLPQALIFNASSAGELEQKLAAFEQDNKTVPTIQPPPARPVILCFGGQISTFVGLDKDVYDSVTIFRNYLDQCDALCLSIGFDSIFPDIFLKSSIEDIVKLQILLFAIQYASAKAWIASGVKVAAVIGHSFGELTALCVSGVLSLKSAMRMIAGRARLIKESWGPDKGLMLAVEADQADLEALLARSREILGIKEDPSIACYNGPSSFTLGGSTRAVEIAEDLAKNDPTFLGIKVKKLNVTNAFHSALVDPLIEDLKALGRGLVFNEPTIKVERSTERAPTSGFGASFLAEHMRNPVFFNQAVHRLASEYPAAIWLEAGSNSTVTTMAGRALNLSSTSHFQPVNVTNGGSFQSLVDTTTRLWKEGLDITFWAHHRTQASEYKLVLLPPYQFEKSQHWMELKEPQKLETPVVVHNPPMEEPKTLTTFMGLQDKATGSVRFRVNTTTEKFHRMVSTHIMAGTTAVTPGMFQLEIALDALIGLRPEFRDLTFQPELRGMTHYNPLVVDLSKDVWLDAEAADDEGLIWDWKIIAVKSLGVSTQHTSGRIVFRPPGQVKEDFQRLARLSGRKRGLQLLDGNEADDVLQGRNIYRAFEQVIDYKDLYRHVVKIVGRDHESAGRVIKPYDGEAWIDAVLTDCFCQVAGIFVNLMTDQSDLSQRGIFICDGIDRWIRSPTLDREAASLPEVWEVFAVHHRESESKFISDVFAFDSRDGSLVEAILGISYQKVTMSGIQKALQRLLPSPGPKSPNRVFSPPVQIGAENSSLFRSQNPFASNALPVVGEKPTKKTKKKAQKPSGPDVPSKTREILCNLSGLDADEIKDDSDLVEIGIDSLMSMELVREVDSAFTCTLKTEQLMDLTDFRSLVLCIRSTLGLGDPEVNGHEDEDDQSEEDEPERRLQPVTNDAAAHVNGTNGTNGVNGLNGYSKTSMDSSNLPESVVLDAFRAAKEATDDFILKGQLGTYYNEVMPRSTELCVAHIINAFEQLGCPLRSAAPGQRLERVPYLPKHERFMDLIYRMLEDARLIDINGSEITRTAVAPPSKSVDVLLEELLRDEPVHAAEHKLTGLIGPRFANCLAGKEDGLQLIFGTPEGREIVTDVYAKSPINSIWIQQAEYFLEQLISRLPTNGEPLRILEMGAGTGGTTSKIVPLLARLGVPVKYTMTDLSSSLIAAARKRFKQYPFMEFKMLNIEAQPDTKLLQSQHIVLATNCVHATRNLTISTSNIHQLLRPDGFLLLLEMTERVPWVDFIFGLLEGWWLFEDGRDHALQPATHWEKILHSVGYGHVDWTEGSRPESNIQRLIIAHASGPRYDRVGPKALLSSPPVHAQLALTDIAGRQALIEAYCREYTRDFRVPSKLGASLQLGLSSSSAANCVLVTGATGSLGSHIVAYAAQLPSVHTVVCLNRPSTTEATLRQLRSFESRGIVLDPVILSKLNVIETDTSKPRLGLSQEDYNNLANSVTHIVHNAWPMSLTRPTRAYEPQFAAMQNLINLASDAGGAAGVPKRIGFQFISSIGVMGNYPIWKGEALAPEQRGTAESALPVGYADAKLVCERMLEETLRRHPDHFRAMAVRIAQITGSTSSGLWNSAEHFASLLKSSQTLRALPVLQGSLSWCPVNDVAATLGELLLLLPHGAEEQVALVAECYPVYHIENPSRQPWPEMVVLLADALGIPQENIIPFDLWLGRIRRFRGSVDDNPAGRVVDFFEKHFIRMSCGGLVLDTARSREHSETLRRRGPVERELVIKYLAAWKASGFLS